MNERKHGYRMIVAGFAGLAALVLMAFRGTPVLPGFLWALLCPLAVSLGGLAVLSMWHLSGGRWGSPLLPVLRSAVFLLPLLACLFVVFLFQLDNLYDWAGPGVKAHAVLEKALYLNQPFFIVRAIGYWILWCVWGFLLLQRKYTGRPKPPVASAGLITYFLTLTFAAVDWVMSLEPAWYSTMYGLIYIVEFGFMALSFGTAVLAWSEWRGTARGLSDPEVRGDLGNLQLAFLLLWAYSTFSQFLIIWMGNLPEEVAWYVTRSTNGWKGLTIMNTLLHALCFFALLSPRAKRNLLALALISTVLLLGRMIDLYWLILPARQPHPLPLAPNILALASVLLIWAGAFVIAYRSVLAHFATAGFLVIVLTLSPAPGYAQAARDLTQETGVDEHLGRQIDMTRSFRTADGKPFSFSELVSRGKPIIVSPVYYRCPQLCPATMRGLVDMVNQLRLSLNDDYFIVSVTMDPEETAEHAANAAGRYTKMLSDPSKAAGWFFLTGEKAEDIAGLMRDIGFRYARDDTNQFVHTAVAVILSPKGMISRYRYGVTFPVGEMRLGMVEASEGKIGNTLDRVLLYCFHFDATTGRYTPAIMNIVRLLGLVTLLLMVIGWMILRRVRPVKRA